ncbi:MAG: anti-sigma factor, partial [Acidimicrobiales bacterium]
TATFTSTRSGWRIELRTNGLPRLDNGRYYQAWMKNGAGVLVPIGTFNQGPEVTLWSGVPPKEFPTITVTEQEANGNPASSGQRVLAGSVAGPASP